ncbi:ATP-binding cassette domain-containing protein [Thermodesulfobacteriota bacterium]
MRLLEAQEILLSLGQERPPVRVSFVLEEGRVLWIEGRSGAGKTTLLRTLARLNPLADGDMRFQGSLWREIPAVTWRTRVVYLHQEAVLFPGTVRDNMEAPFHFANRKPDRHDPAQVDEMLAKLLLPSKILDQDALSLSVGEASRVALIRAVITDPQVLLLDEPTAALDAKSRRAAASLLTEWLDEKGRGIIAVSHDDSIVELLPGEKISL